MTTIELPPDQVPLLRVPEGEAVQALVERVVEYLGTMVGELQQGDPNPSMTELARIADAYMKGKGVVFLTLHVEPPTIVRRR